MSIADNLDNLGRKAGKARIIAVSKQQPMEKIQEALAAGHRHFGENRVQEAYAHWQEIRAHGEYPDLRLHLIGPLQTNKVREALALFDVIETLDREKLAAAIADEIRRRAPSLPPQLYIQVNTGHEPQKAGISPTALPGFLQACREKYGLHINGLMCIPPQEDPPTLHFALLRKLALEQGLPELSMGMSADFEKAVALDATSVRLGSAVFGTRQER